MDKKCYRLDHSIFALFNDCIELVKCWSASDGVMIFYLSLVLGGGMWFQLIHASKGCHSAIDGSIQWLVN